MKNVDKNSSLYNGEAIRALTWKQPFAELMLHGKIETRTWSTDYRGWVLICAGLQTYNGRELSTMLSADLYSKNQHLFENIVRGGSLYCGKAIAVGQLTDCRPMEPSDVDKCFVDYHPGLYCHIYENVAQIEPMPWKGSQGWRQVPEEVKSKIITLECR
jgi:hypothetical protein